MKLKISENIKNLRLAKGLTQSELALLLSVTPQSVSRWENGQAYPDMETLPLIANIFDVSYNELMGDSYCVTIDTEKLKRLFLELRHQAALSPSYETELRALEIGDEIAKREPGFLITYFTCLISFKEKYGKISEKQIQDVKERVHKFVKESDFSTQITWLYNIVSYEDDAGLEIWKDEYSLPYYYKHLEFWDEMLLFRYLSKADSENHEITREKIIFDKLCRAISLLSDCEITTPDKKTWLKLKPPQNHKTALDTINVYSGRFDDIFCMIRTVTEFRYALSLFDSGLDEEGFSMLDTVKDHISAINEMPDGKLLYGSVPPLKKAFIKLDKSDFYTDKCLMYIIVCRRNPRYQRLSEDHRFAGFFEYVNSLLPNRGKSTFFYADPIAANEWEPLISLAREKCPEEKDGQVVIAKSSGGNYYSFVYEKVSDATDAKGFLKMLAEQLQNPQDTKIEKIVTMWHGELLDLPSFALRDLLCKLNPKNLEAEILVSTFQGLASKKLSVTMGKGYKEKIQ